MINFNFSEVSDGISRYDFNFTPEGSIHFILRSNNNYHNAIWCDPTTSLKNGRFYIGNEKDLTIINVKDGQAYIEDYFSKNLAGSTNKKLNHEDITDMVVAF